MDNIFNLPNPNQWGCIVTQLAKGHGLLVIKLINKSNADGPVQLEFSNVDYFGGWTAWRGCNFRVGTNKELVNLVTTVAPRYKNSSEYELLKLSPFASNRLFICNTVEDDTIYIIANAGRTLNARGDTVIEY